MIEDMNKKVVKAEIKVDVITEYKKFLTDANLDSLKKHLGGKINYSEVLKFVFDKLLSVNLNEIDKYINLIKKIIKTNDKILEIDVDYAKETLNRNLLKRLEIAS